MSFKHEVMRALSGINSYYLITSTITEINFINGN